MKHAAHEGRAAQVRVDEVGFAEVDPFERGAREIRAFKLGVARAQDSFDEAANALRLGALRSGAVRWGDSRAHRRNVVAGEDRLAKSRARQLHPLEVAADENRRR